MLNLANNLGHSAIGKITNGSAQIVGKSRLTMNSATQKTRILSQGWLNNYHQNPMKQVAVSTALVGAIGLISMTYAYSTNVLLELAESMIYSPEENPDLVYTKKLVFNTVASISAVSFSYMLLDSSTIIFHQAPLLAALSAVIAPPVSQASSGES